MDFKLLDYKELNARKRRIKGIDPDNMTDADLAATLDIALHYLTAYHYCGNQNRHMLLAKRYLEKPYEFNKCNLKYIVDNINKYLSEYEREYKYILSWIMLYATEYNDAKYLDMVAYKYLILYASSVITNDKKISYYWNTYSLLSILVDTKSYDNALNYMIVLYLFNQNKILLNKIINKSKSYKSFKHLLYLSKYIDDIKMRNELIDYVRNNIDSNNILERELLSNSKNSLTDFEHLIIDNVIKDINISLDKEYYKPLHLIELAYNNRIIAKYDYEELKLKTQDLLFNKAYNSIIYKLSIDIIRKGDTLDLTDYRVIQLLTAIINNIYDKRYATARFYKSYVPVDQNMLYIGDYDYDKLYDKLLDTAIDKINIRSAKLFKALKCIDNPGMLDYASKLIRDIFDKREDDLKESSVIDASNSYFVRNGLEELACKYFWDNKYYDEYLLIFEFLYFYYRVFGDINYSTDVVYKIACYYLISDESRFNLELGIKYLEKYKELDFF